MVKVKLIIVHWAVQWKFPTACLFLSYQSSVIPSSLPFWVCTYLCSVYIWHMHYLAQLCLKSWYHGILYILHGLHKQFLPLHKLIQISKTHFWAWFSWLKNMAQHKITHHQISRNIIRYSFLLVFHTESFHDKQF